MTIQRQYSLPNCKLALEGLSHEVTDPAAQTGRLSLDVLIRFECHLPDQKKPLVGGRDLLENLAAAASQCAQELLSGIYRLDRATLNGESPSAQLKLVSTNQFRLVIPTNLLFDSTPSSEVTSPDHDTVANHDAKKLPPVELDLSLVQVFDLVEAFDQLLADTQTLPDLSVRFSPLSRRDAVSRQPTAKQAVPIALGVASLGVAGIGFFLIPVPEVRKPDPRLQEPAPSQNNPEQPSSPLVPNRTEPSPSPKQQSSLSTPLAASMITNRQQLQVLNQTLYTQIARAWKTKPTFYQDLIYRVSVDQSGKIVGYRPVNQAAIDYKQTVPLLDLLDSPAPIDAALKSESTPQRGLAQFQVVFDPKGDLQIKPWGDG